MIVEINGRPVYVADSRAARVKSAMRRKNHSIARELKQAGLLPSSVPGNSLFFQTGSDHYCEPSQTETIVVRTRQKDKPPSHISHTVKFSK